MYMHKDFRYSTKHAPRLETQFHSCPLSQSRSGNMKCDSIMTWASWLRHPVHLARSTPVSPASCAQCPHSDRIPKGPGSSDLGRVKSDWHWLLWAVREDRMQSCFPHLVLVCTASCGPIRPNISLICLAWPSSLSPAESQTEPRAVRSANHH